MTQLDTLRRIADEYGGATGLAHALGRTPQDVGNLVNGRSPIPVAFAFEVEVLTQGAVRATDLRPDLEVWLAALRELSSSRP